ncbi:MAG: carboxypeptidase-like regulatory domain-containing protein, partial [Bryobacteraceae bacterium]
MSQWLLWLAVCCILCSLGNVSAQISTATLVGTVTDPSGAVVVGATVQVKNIGTSITRTAATDASGEYTIPNLPAARYSV